MARNILVVVTEPVEADPRSSAVATLEYTEKYPMTYVNDYKNIYVYTNIVKPTIMGDYFANILRIVAIPDDVPTGAQIAQQYDKVHYYPLDSNEFETVEIAIKDSQGLPVAFNSGSVIVTLHFRRHSDS